MLPWKRLSQATATTVLGVAMLAAFETSKASAVSLKTFNVSGTFGDAISGSSDVSFIYKNGSFDGTYIVDVDQLPTTTSVGLEALDINLRDSSGVIRDQLSSSIPGITGRPAGLVLWSQSK